MGVRNFVLLLGALATVLVPGSPDGYVEPPPALIPVPAGDYFQYPLPTWESHCLGFGSEWRLCDRTVLRACPSGAVWLHTGVDIQAGNPPGKAASGGGLNGC